MLESLRPVTLSQDLAAVLARQRAAYLADGIPSAALRRDRIRRIIALVTANAAGFVETMKDDFGHRSSVQSLMTDVIGILPAMKSDMKQLARWMKPQRVRSGQMGLLGARSRIEYIPRGVVGIISPWNFPLALALQPLAQAFAAGNRAMVKVSEFTPATAALLQQSVAGCFAPEEAVVVTGGPEVGAQFSRLPFDLMFFTGAASIGRHVQRACAENLVPCVLELGGKSPVILGPAADFGRAAKRIALGKTLNAGQICLSPDHVYVPAGREREFIEAMRRAISALYPTLLNNDDYTSIISERHRDRLLSYLIDARDKGAELIEINPASERFDPAQTRKLPPTLMLNVDASMQVMQEEIFGPLLPVMPYTDISDVIRDVNGRPRPLAAYYFGGEDAACRKFLDNTASGGVTIDDVILHVANENLPFGGIGDSGMGVYHGFAGFQTFSHARAIVKCGWKSPNEMLAPPYRPRTRKILKWMLNRERRSAVR